MHVEKPIYFYKGFILCLFYFLHVSASMMSYAMPGRGQKTELDPL